MGIVLPECLLEHLFRIQLVNYKFHKIFYKLKKKSEYAEILGNIRFCGSSVNPYSEALDEALFNLQFAGVLSRANPELVLYSRTDKFDASYDRLIKDLDKLSREFLQEIQAS
jgi:hypothetical protein